MSACARISCKAAVQTGHHAARSYRRIHITSISETLSDSIFNCSVPNRAGNALTCYIHHASAQLRVANLEVFAGNLGMQTSNYFKQALFHQSSHETDQFFESRSEALFQHPGNISFIEVHHQLPGQQELPDSAAVLDSVQDSDCPRPFFLDVSGRSSLDEDPPPTYGNSPRLLKQRILDLKDVQKIEMVSALVSALRNWTYTIGSKGDEAPFPHMVRESSEPSNRVPF